MGAAVRRFHFTGIRSKHWRPKRQSPVAPLRLTVGMRHDRDWAAVDFASSRAGASQSRLRRWERRSDERPPPQRASMLLRSAKSSGRRISVAIPIVAVQVLFSLLFMPAAYSQTLRVGKAVPE